MKMALSVLVPLAVITPSFAAEKTPPPSAVVVRVLAKPLPPEGSAQTAFLWDNFANQPDEQQFNSYTAEKWKSTFTTFAEVLEKKAKDQRLDAVSLRKALDLVMKDSQDMLAYLPVGAYQTTLAGSPVWIITVKWENAAMGKKSELSHIRAFAFDQRNLKRVGFMTCQ
jgi:hypothetical protein